MSRLILNSLVPMGIGAALTYAFVPELPTDGYIALSAIFAMLAVLVLLFALLNEKGIADKQ